MQKIMLKSRDDLIELNVEPVPNAHIKITDAFNVTKQEAMPDYLVGIYEQFYQSMMKKALTSGKVENVGFCNN